MKDARVLTDYAHSIEEPDWEKVLGALMRLDGDQASFLSVHLPGVGVLMVGGGNEGRFVVTYTADLDGTSLALTRVTTDERRFDVVVQEDTCDYAAKHCVGLEMVVETFRAFFHSGHLPQELLWEDC